MENAIGAGSSSTYCLKALNLLPLVRGPLAAVARRFKSVMLYIGTL